MENTMKMYITADEVAELLGVSRGYMKILSEGQQKIQSFSRICLRNLVFREKTLKQYILMSIQNMKAIRTEIRAGSEDLKVISIITI